MWCYTKGQLVELRKNSQYSQSQAGSAGYHQCTAATQAEMVWLMDAKMYRLSSGLCQMKRYRKANYKGK